MKKVGKFILYIILFLISILTVYKYVVTPYIFAYYLVVSNSMSPTFKKGDLVGVYKLNTNNINRNDIILFEPVEGIFNEGVWTHRVIGIENDEITIKNNLVTLDDRKALFPNVMQKKKYERYQVKKNELFQKGDNSATLYGPIDKKHIIGKVVHIYNLKK